MIFANFPVALIIWVVFAIAYQQFENYVIQPQIQKRATEIEPFVVLVAVLFGSTLFGVMGAILAIPAAAAILITFNEWPGAAFRRPSPERILAFQRTLLDAGLTATIRWSKGEDVGAACGQLAS